MATDGVGTDGSLLCSNGMTSRLSCCGESVLQRLAQNKAILSWCGDSGTTVRGRLLVVLYRCCRWWIVLTLICICYDLRTLS